MERLRKILTGHTQEHLESISVGKNLIRIHSEAKKAFLALRKEAKHQGFDLAIVSSFRDFSSQLRIWNAKASGDRPILDEKGSPIDIAPLESREVVFAILRWSALPGASRHHWGTDIDVYDANLRERNQVSLTPEEVQCGGIFAPLHEWLDKNLARFDFFRPYAEDHGGVSPERWHLSYAPVAADYLKKIKLAHLQWALRDSELQLKQTVQQMLPEIFNRFVTNVDSP